MKKVTYEEWQKNPIPREMWVWDNDEKYKMKRMVVYITDVNENEYPVISVNKDGGVAYYKHYAEIEKQRRMTNKELSRWLREKPTREYKYKKTSDYIYSFYEYKECHADEELDDLFLIREDDGEWQEPFVEE